MCGIVGYIGKNEALPILVDGLKRLEYRGYDSSGVALCDKNDVLVFKSVGKINNLEKLIAGKNIKSNLGIAHTRWATHGEPSKVNAHPHSDCQGDIFLVHNGIIENYQALKNKLKADGHTFLSETDTEVIAHLIEDFYTGDLVEAVQKTLKIIKGAYGLLVFHKNEPDKLIAVKYGSPLAVGLSENETIIASDVASIIRLVP